MELTENLNTMSDWILTKLSNIDNEIATYERAVPLLKAERVKAFYDMGSVIYSKLTDDERAIIETQRPDLVEILTEQAAQRVLDDEAEAEAELILDTEEAILTEETV